jgi:class 3 adenylate cyclase
VIAGYTGTQRRATYTCVGDTVNLAARLEAHSKVTGMPIMIDAATRAGLDDDISAIDQGWVRFKGKTQELQVYAVGPVGD